MAVLRQKGGCGVGGGRYSSVCKRDLDVVGNFVQLYQTFLYHNPPFFMNIKNFITSNVITEMTNADGFGIITKKILLLDYMLLFKSCFISNDLSNDTNFVRQLEFFYFYVRNYAFWRIANFKSISQQKKKF